MTSDKVDLDVSDGLATVTLDHQEKMNALSPGIVDGVDRAYREIDERDDVRCVVIQGAGDAFCAGGDIQGMAERDGVGSGHERARGIYESVERVALQIWECDVPTIGRIDGYCFGAGLGVALANDVLLASEDASFSLAFRNVGLSVDYATAFFVPRAVGLYKAKELALTGERVSGERAAEIGLVNHAYPSDEFDERADEFIATVAEGPTVALGYSLQNIEASDRMGIRDVVEAESRSQVIAGNTRDHEEGVQAFVEGRDPEFEGR